MYKVEQCPICSCDNLEPYGLSSSKNNIHFAQMVCTCCGLLVSSPQLESDELEAFYSQRYYEENNPDGDANHEVNYSILKRYEVPLLKQLWPDWPPSRGGKALEIGCGYGVTLRLLQDEGFEVCGTELSKRSLEYCQNKGFNVRQEGLPGLTFEKNQFDLVITRHVIEHVSQPTEFLGEIVSLLRPGGIVAVVTDDGWNSTMAWDRFRHWVRGRVPRFYTSTQHTFIFQQQHIKRLLRELGCDKVSSAAFHLIASGESLHWKAYKSLFRTMDRLLGHGDYIMVLGRKALDAPNAKAA